MKKVISLITMVLLQISCFAVNVETTINLNVYYPEFTKIDLICGQMPKASQKDVEFCCEAAFTGKLPEWECLDGRTKLTIYLTPNIVRLNARITEYIATKKVGGSFSKQDYLQYWNYKISDPTAKNDLQQMVNAGLCRKDGSGPATRYVVLANN